MTAPRPTQLLDWTASALQRTSDSVERLARKMHQTQPAGQSNGTAPLTRRIDVGLLSRCVEQDAFARAVGTALLDVRHRPGTVGVIAVKIDQFTALIASHGAAIGNEVLAAVADRLHEAVRPGDLVTRVGADGFAMLWRTTSSPAIEADRSQTIVDCAHRLARRFDAPVDTTAGEIRVAVSVGTAAVTEAQAATIDDGTLMQQASTAVRQAEELGRAQVVAFDLSMEQQAVQKYRTETELRTALRLGEVDVHYQPIVSLDTGRVVGLEALARWQHEALGAISPGLFIPIAEESGLINELGAYVMDEAVRQGIAWNAESADALVTINLSSRQLLDRNLVHAVKWLLDTHQADPTRLCLEVTESIVMNDVATSMTILGQLKDLGLCLAIDDFGTGYSSLSYLRRLPVDILKIDRSFVHSINNRDDRMIIKAIIDLAHTLGMTTVAEGIENRMQVEVLHALNCDMAQGFLLHRPAAAGDVDLTPIDFSTQAQSFAAVDARRFPSAAIAI